MQEKRKKVETGTEKQGTEVLLRTKIIIGISAFILIFTLIIIGILWFKAAQGRNVEATLFSLISMVETK
jgi:hypothetical protein